MKLRRSALAALIVLILVGSAWLLLSRVELSSYQDPEVWNLNNALQLAIVFEAFAEENSGCYPPSIDAVVPGMCSAEEMARIRYYRDGKSKRMYDYLYFPGLAVTSDSNLPLIAAPGPVDGKRIVVRVDGKQGRFPEQLYQEMKNQYYAQPHGGVERPSADAPGRRSP